MAWTACRVLFVDYRTILPPHDDHRGGRPPAEIAEWGRAIAAQLTTTQAAAEAARCEYVAASAASASHHAWSASPWM